MLLAKITKRHQQEWEFLVNKRFNNEETNNASIYGFHRAERDLFDDCGSDSVDGP
jgi:hypothetical protein